MKGIFLVFHGFASYNGISKKIFYQVDALRVCGMEVKLCSLIIDKDGTQKRMLDEEVLEDFGSGIGAKIKKRICYRALTDYIRKNDIRFVYMRCDHNANPFLNHWLKQVKKAGVRVVMEIPTYPYDGEYKQSRKSRKLNLMIDRIFRGAMARQLYRIVTFTDYKTIFGIPTINISNGIEFGKIPLKKQVNDTSRQLRLIGVADIHFWHGFDRIIAGLAEYYRNGADYEVIFNIVGSGVQAEIDRLHRMVSENGLEGKVIFHGAKSGDELDRMFEESDMGVASLARHRSGITQIKTLKNREYAARGIPFVYSETDSDFDTMPYILKVPADESPVAIPDIIEFYRNTAWTPAQIRESIIDKLSWQSQMQKVIDETLK